MLGSVASPKSEYASAANKKEKHHSTLKINTKPTPPKTTTIKNKKIVIKIALENSFIYKKLEIDTPSTQPKPSDKRLRHA
jgi:hypothetical protein